VVEIGPNLFLDDDRHQWSNAIKEPPYAAGGVEGQEAHLDIGAEQDPGAGSAGGRGRGQREGYAGMRLAQRLHQRRRRLDFADRDGVNPDRTDR
jgi:hypothetical protein